MSIKLNGFSHKLFKLFKTIVMFLQTFSPDPERFKSMKEVTRRKYANSMLEVTRYGRSLRLRSTLNKSYLGSEVVEALENVTFEVHSVCVHTFFLISHLLCRI